MMMITSFKDSFQKNGFKKNKMKLKTRKLLSSLYPNDVGINLRDSPFKSHVEISNLHLTDGTSWVVYINYNYFNSPPQNYLCLL